MKNSKRIVMLGTRFDTMGGIASVVSVYRDAGLFERWPILYIATHRDGGKFAKLSQASRAALLLLGQLLTLRVAMLHVHLSSGPSFWRKFGLITMARMFGIRYVCHLHSGGFTRFYDSSSRISRWLIRDTFQSAEAVVVLSEEWKLWVESALHCRRARVIPNPVLIPPPAARSTKDCVLFLGRLCEKKGIYDLLQAVARLASEFPDLHLLAGGDGEHERAAAQAKALGIADRFQILGWVTGRAKAELTSRAAVYVLPSYVENLPMGVLEAMAAGLPVLTTPIGGIPSTIDHGKDGWLVPPGDVEALTQALRTLLSDAGLRDRIGDAARRKAVARFSAEKVMADIDTLYIELGMERLSADPIEAA